MLKQVCLELRQRKLEGRVREIDRPVRGDVEIVCATERKNAGCFGGECGYLPVSSYCEQAFDCISDNQISIVIEDEAQRPSMGVGKNFGARAIRLESKYLAIPSPALQTVLIVDSNVLRAERINAKSFNLSQFGILGVWTGEFRRGRRCPGRRVDWDWPGE